MAHLNTFGLCFPLLNPLLLNYSYGNKRKQTKKKRKTHKKSFISRKKDNLLARATLPCAVSLPALRPGSSYNLPGSVKSLSRRRLRFPSGHKHNSRRAPERAKLGSNGRWNKQLPPPARISPGWRGTRESSGRDLHLNRAGSKTRRNTALTSATLLQPHRKQSALYFRRMRAVAPPSQRRSDHHVAPAHGSDAVREGRQGRTSCLKRPDRSHKPARRFLRQCSAAGRDTARSRPPRTGRALERPSNSTSTHKSFKFFNFIYVHLLRLIYSRAISFCFFSFFWDIWKTKKETMVRCTFPHQLSKLSPPPGAPLLWDRVYRHALWILQLLQEEKATNSQQYAHHCKCF